MTAIHAVAHEPAMSSWLDAACRSLAHVADTALGLAAGPFELVAPLASNTGLAAYVPVLTPGAALQIGIVAEEDSCRELARALLQQPSVDAGDVADAIDECRSATVDDDVGQMRRDDVAPQTVALHRRLERRQLFREIML